MNKNEQLLEVEENSKYFIWIDGQSGFNENGLHYTSYYSEGGVGVLRSALEPSDKQSIPWLQDKQIELLEKLVVKQEKAI